MSRRIRALAWTVLIAIAAYQAYAQRYAISPDGVSYLDMSDAIVTGEWSRLVNLYWSPAYPLLIGVARWLTGAGPASEIQVVHAVNLACFVAMLAAFDYMLASVLSLAAEVRDSILGGWPGAAIAYFLFGCSSLIMLPQELTTPDILNAAAAFAAFGAILRLYATTGVSTDTTMTIRPAAAARRDATVLGVSLGAGALIKSFMVPWAIVCLAAVALAVYRRGRRQLRYVALAAGMWLLFVAPWSVIMSRAAGRFTFGDAGRLTYAWYVNEQYAPSAGGVPPGALRPATQRILPGVGVPGDTTGSDPMWFDPARWNRSVTPHLDIRQQLGMIRVFELFYIKNLTPVLLLIVLIAVAPSGARLVSWRRGWVVYVPALAALGAYAMVIVTTRYIMAFLVAGALVLLATLPRPRRMLPFWLFVGVGVPVVLEAIQPKTIAGLSFIAAILGGLLVGVLMPMRRPLLWFVAIVVAMMATRVLLTPVVPDLLRAGAAALAVLLWRAALAAVRRRRTVQFARRARLAVGAVVGVVLVLRVGLRLRQDTTALRRAASAEGGNPQLKIARALQQYGIGPGARLAVIGPHAESYWVRTARAHIVANVPRTLTDEFWALSATGRDSLLSEFAKAGATVAVASVGPASGAPDSSWTPIRYHGWIRRLSAATP